MTFCLPRLDCSPPKYQKSIQSYQHQTQMIKKKFFFIRLGLKRYIYIYKCDNPSIDTQANIKFICKFIFFVPYVELQKCCVGSKQQTDNVSLF